VKAIAAGVRSLWNRFNSSSALLIALIITLAPFWRGLFFTIDQLAFSIPIFSIGLVWFWRLRKNLKVDKLDLTVLGLTAMYCLSNVVAQNRYQALGWALQLVAMAIIYLILSRELLGFPKAMHQLLQLMVVMSSLVALNGLLAYSGLVWGLVDAVLYDRLTATFQYPNTAAAFFNTGMILCLLAMEMAEKRWQKGLYSGLYLLQVIAFFLCRSRIAFMQFAVLLLGMLILAPWKHKLRLGAVGGANLVLGMVATNRMQELFRRANEAGEIWRQGAGMPAGMRLNLSPMSLQGLGWVLGAFLMGVALYYLLSPLLASWERSTPSRARQRQVTYGILVGTVIMGLLIVSSLFIPALSEVMRTILGPFLPVDLTNAITNISASDVNYTSRLMFMGNALSIARDYPLLGTGGGGYASVYSRYQPIFSTSRFTHSQPFQVLSEAGIPGMLFYIGMWVLATWMVLRLLWRSFQAEEDDPRHLYLAGLLPAIWAIGAHSTFDFDLTYVAMQMWVYTMLAFISAICHSPAEVFAAHHEELVTGKTSPSPVAREATSRATEGRGRRSTSAAASKSSPPLIAYVVPISLAILLFFNLPMYVSEVLAEQAGRELDYYQSFAIYDNSLSWIDYNSRVLNEYVKECLAFLTMVEDAGTRQAILDRAIALSTEALANDPLNPDWHFYLQLVHYYNNDWGKAHPGAYELIKASPYWPSGYDLASRIFARSLLNLTERGETNQLRELARYITSWEAVISNPLHANNFSSQSGFAPANINLCLAMAHVILHNDAQGQQYISLALESLDTISWAALLQAALLQRQGNVEGANMILNLDEMEGARESDIYQIMLLWR